MSLYVTNVEPLTAEDLAIAEARPAAFRAMRHDERDAEINRACGDITLGEYPNAARRRYFAAIGLTGEDRVAVYS